MPHHPASRRDFLKYAGLGAAGLLAGASAGPTFAAADKRPNLIYVFADMLRYQSCGYAGDKVARTPNIDKLATQGISFSNAISTMPVCSAYRACLMTGKYPTTTGMVINELRFNPNQQCLGHVLTRAGYQTGYIGKWHLYANEMGSHNEPRNSFVPPGPHRLGFDGLWAAYNFHHDYYGSYYHANTAEKIFYGKGVYEPEAQTDLAINFLRQNAGAGGKDQPFALVLSYGPPHDPWSEDNVPKEYADAFKEADFPNPPNYREQNDAHVDNWARLTPQFRARLAHARRIYYAMTASLDAAIGRLLTELDKLGLADNTVLVFSSDHGEMFGAQGRRAKNIFYEESARIPLLVRWPGHTPAGKTSDACIGTVDMMPTLLGLLGLDTPKGIEGMNLAHCALGQPGPEPDAALLMNTGACASWQDGYEWRALRDKRYTYATYRADRSELLFDNVADPYQMKNLAADPAHQEAMDRFRKLLKEKMASIEDTFEASTWYRDHWIKDRCIQRGARGEFGA